MIYDNAVTDMVHDFTILEVGRYHAFVINTEAPCLHCRFGRDHVYRFNSSQKVLSQQYVTTREAFFRAYVVLFQVAVGCLPTGLSLRDTSFCRYAHQRLG